MPSAMKPLFVKLVPQDRERLNRIAAACGVAEGRPVTLSDVVRQLVRDAAKRSTPVRIKAEGA